MGFRQLGVFYFGFQEEKSGIVDSDRRAEGEASHGNTAPPCKKQVAGCFPKQRGEALLDHADREEELEKELEKGRFIMSLKQICINAIFQSKQASPVAGTGVCSLRMKPISVQKTLPGPKQDEPVIQKREDVIAAEVAVLT